MYWLHPWNPVTGAKNTKTHSRPLLKDGGRGMVREGVWKYQARFGISDVSVLDECGLVRSIVEHFGR